MDVRSRILWIKFRFSRVKVCAMAEYGANEDDVEERSIFWNDLDMIKDRIGNGYRLSILGDINGWF